MSRTNAGIEWIRDSLPASAKFLGGQWALDWFYKRGVTREELESDWNRYAGGSGFLNYANQKELENLVCTVLPDFSDFYKEHSKHQGAMGHTLVHRARLTVMKQEMKRWAPQPWIGFRSALIRAYHNPHEERVTPEKRAAIHEKLVLCRVEGLPGVYVNLDPLVKERAYVGTAKDVANRQKGHSNSPLRTQRVYVTPSEESARHLETELHRKIELAGILTGSKLKGDVGRKGVLYLSPGVNLVEVLDELVREHYRSLCRVKVGWL